MPSSFDKSVAKKRGEAGSDGFVSDLGSDEGKGAIKSDASGSPRANNMRMGQVRRVKKLLEKNIPGAIINKGVLN